MSSTLLDQVAEGFRLSPQQRRVWHLYESHPFAEFGCQCTVWIPGPLDCAQLDKAIRRVAAQHEILRTDFAVLEGSSVPVQIVHDSASGLDEIASLRFENKTRPNAEFESIAGPHWSPLVQPGRTSGYRFDLAKDSDGHHALIITASGLCSDSESLINLARLVQNAYQENDVTDPEGLQYADLAEWQSQLIESNDDSSLYWRSTEFSELSFPRLPFQLEPAREASEFTYETAWRAVPSVTAAALHQLSCRLQVPAQAVFLTAWQTVLHRLTGMERFVTGVRSGGRVQPELREGLGAFAKCLPLMASLEGNPQFATLAQQVGASLEVAHCDHLLFDFEPFGIPDPSLRRRLFPVIFSYQARRSAEVAESSAWRIGPVVECLEPFELRLEITAVGECLRLELAWESHVFLRQDIEALADTLLALMDEIAGNPERRIHEFTLASANVPLSIVTGRAAEDQPWRAIHEIVEEHARRTPDKLAAVCDGERITYAELDRRASILANRLQQAGATDDSVVALIAERSVSFIVGVLAILKSGAAWLPIEPDTPDARKRSMLRQTSAVALLAQPGRADGLRTDGLPVVSLDDDEQPATSLRRARRVHPAQCAYVIFTSGSTGQPKGVAIEHRQISAYLRALSERVDLSSCANFAVVSTLAADLGHTAVFGSLLSGGCLHIISSSRALNADALAEYFVRHAVDFVKIVPSHLETLCRSFSASVKLPWRYVLAGGELLTWRLVEMTRQIAPDCAIFNHYGPTETAVGVSCGPAKLESTRFQDVGVPIGRPFAGVSAYLLDEHGRPVPVWMAGELYIGGDSVGRGYLGRSDLTAERFLPDPFAEKPGMRMYRTGDLARYRSDGLIEFLGRRDGQVKIRGYRVELGEVESVLRTHPDVQKAAVIVSEDNSSGRHLVAFAAIGSAKVSPDELREFAGRSLPPYMIPKVIVCVDGLKLTPNGKIDRQALVDAIPAPASAQFCGPADEVEESLVAVWRSVLGIEGIGVEDNYFSLGGDSLRVIQIVHGARQYGIDIAAADILSCPTIRQLRQELRNKSLRGLFPDGAPPASFGVLKTSQAHVPADVTDCYPLSGIQTFMLDRYSSSAFHVQDCFQIVDSNFCFSSLEEALQAVMDRHPALRTVFDLREGRAMQWVRTNLRCPITLEDISHLEASPQEEHIAAAVHRDRNKPFDPTQQDKPLFRVHVIQRSASEFHLVFSCHHAIMDGWGHRILLNDLVSAYLSIKSGARPELGHPDTACREFVAFQEAVRNSEKAAAFWREYLAGVSPAALKPSPSHPGGHAKEGSMLRHFTAAVSESLRDVARSCSISMQALTLSAWFEVLREISGQQLVVTGVVANGRSEYLADPLSAVGLFWNLVPVVSRKHTPFSAQAAQVQKDLVEAAPYSAYPITQLLADCGNQELFFSTFRYLNFWNTKPVPAESGLRIVDVQFYGRYSVPLNCSVVIDPVSNEGYVQIEYDRDYFSDADMSAALQRCAELLETVASNTKV